MSEESFEGEVWKVISGYKGRYEVSTHGRVRSLLGNNIILSQQTNSAGYSVISLRDKTSKLSRLRVHRLVAQTFIPNDSPTVRIKVDHIDEDKTNNNVLNLQWVTESENTTLHYKRKNKKKYLTVTQYKLDGEFIKNWNSPEEICTENQILLHSFMQHLRGETKSFYGYKWIGEINPNYKEPVKRPKNDLDILKTDEEFKNIGILDKKDFSNYEISNYGNIRNAISKLILLNTIADNYVKSRLIDKFTGKGISVFVHRLVAHVYIDGRTEEKWTVNHKDKNSLNNHVLNLEWASSRDQSIHCLGKKIQQLNSETGEVINTFNSISEARTFLKLKPNSFNNLSERISVGYCSHGFRWKYVD